MKHFIIKRTLLLIFLLFAVSTAAFFLLRLIPGDPVMGMYGEISFAAELQDLNTDLNPDASIWKQYLSFFKKLAMLDLGTSLFNNKPVIHGILSYFPNTLYLGTAAMTFAVLISFPMGTLAAFKENTTVDSIITFISSAGTAVPNFFLGPLLIILFSVKLELLPVSGSEGVKSLILPMLTLGLSMSAFLTRIIRTAISAELVKPYILFARAKGLDHRRIFFNHLLKNAMIPIITTAGLQLAALLSGTIITENIFSRQGIGTLLIQSINRRDYPMSQGLIIFLAFIYLFINFLVDISYFFLDPRIRHEIKNT